MKRHMFVFTDGVIIAAVAVVAVFSLLLFTGGEGQNAVISVEGEQIKVMPLDTDGDFSVEGVTVTVKGGEAFVSDSDCPDKICMSGRLKSAGDAALCLPNRVSVVIDGDTDTDGVTY